MKKLMLATRNHGKIKEIEDLLKDLPIEIHNVSEYPTIPEVVEDEETLEGNAIKKAKIIFEATGIPSMADDTGLEVFYLGMAPGVISARYAGENVNYEDNNRKLLKELEGVPAEKRVAQFRCIAAFVDTGVEKTTEGICRGKIISDLRGTGGFGYDPLFIPDGFNETFAELPLVVKNQISHRAEAFLKMKALLSSYFKQ